MGYRYDEGVKPLLWPRLSGQENGGAGGKEAGGHANHLELVPPELALTSGFTFMKPFLERRIRSDACLKRQELITKKSSRQREPSDWSNAEKAAFEVEWYENQVEWIETIHQMCGEPIFWDQIAAWPAPFLRGEPGPHEKRAEEEYQEYKPTRMQKLLKQDSTVKQELEDRLAWAREKDRSEYAEWKSLTDFARDVLEGNRTSYLRVLEEIAPMEDLLTLGSGLEFNVLDAETVEVELDVNSGGIIPKESKRMTEEGVLSHSRFSAEAYHELERKYVFGSVFRIARELFALLPLESVLIHARDTKVNPETGLEEYVTLLSVRFDRSVLTAKHLDPDFDPDSGHNPGTHMLDAFPHHMQFEASTGFKPVEPLSRS
ncbi:hypothetical protein [Paenibacillus chibensis]|uniref:hypothetical protein n=1 Tax=Paenibacillus chibensis TaxID=59846 RepID=UPI000FD89504|nr:hypothetical protein [Paenibacillus chibensis]MEC0369763.1 hypothetical protein [Paenibacillus chibensis]